MYFLDSIEGTSGEKLTSALLKYLLVNSDYFRSKFLSRFEEHFASSEVPSFRNGVMCHNEYTSESIEGHTNMKGFIDLLVIADNVVLGIENKLWADFTEDQPKKYADTLCELAKQHCLSDTAYRIIVIAPEERREKVLERLREQQLHSAFYLDWQAVMKDLQAVAVEDVGETGTIAGFFNEYLIRHIADVQLKIVPEKLVGRSVHVGNTYHWDFLYRIKDLFKNTSRMGSSDNYWAGFYFQFDGQDLSQYHKQWFGFHRGVNLPGRPVELMIQTRLATLDLTGIDDKFQRSEQSLDNNMCIKIAVDESCDTVPKWQDFLHPLLERLKHVIVPSCDESQV